MKKRQIIILASTLLILVAGYGGCSILAGMKKAPERKVPQKTFRLVKVMEVKNDTLVKIIAVQGKLIAEEKVEIFPEVTGRLLSTNKPFKLGQKFSKGEVLLAIDGNESMLNLKSQRSSFISSLSQVLPDIKIDYPNSFDAWKVFSDDLNPDELLPDLPELSDSKLKSFLSGRNVFQQYYAIRSLENRQSKFTINQVEPVASPSVTIPVMMIDGVTKLKQLNQHQFNNNKLTHRKKKRLMNQPLLEVNL